MQAVGKFFLSCKENGRRNKSMTQLPQEDNTGKKNAVTPEILIDAPLASTLIQKPANVNQHLLCKLPLTSLLLNSTI